LTSKGQLVVDYLKKFEGLSYRQISAKLHLDHPELFKDLEDARVRVRYYTGTMGKKNRNKATSIVKSERSIEMKEKYGLKKSKSKGRKVYQIPVKYNRVCWISDLHIPNHDSEAITTALNYAKANDANCIIIGGDLMDNAPFTRFRVPPSARMARSIFEDTISFLKALRANFPDALILFMEGNHDRWYTDWLIDHCSVVFDDPYYHIESRLGLADLGIEYLKENVIVKAGKLPMLHGHTIVKGVFAPVNAARGAYIKSNHNLLIGHTHQVSVHSAKDLMGRPTKTWSTGCLCTLQPDYDPHNIRHCHGFAFITTDKNGNFAVNNIEIVDGEIR
jgi:predicted phosphodiesterase